MSSSSNQHSLEDRIAALEKLVQLLCDRLTELEEDHYELPWQEEDDELPYGTQGEPSTESSDPAVWRSGYDSRWR